MSGTEIHANVPLTLCCTVYDVMGLPPSDAGGVHVKDTLVTPDCAVKSVGASGAPYVDAVAIALYGPVPTAFTAATSKSYNVPSYNGIFTAVTMQ